VHPQLSAASASCAAALFVAHVLMGYSLASMAAQLAVLALATSAAVALHNGLNGGAALPQLRVPLDRASMSQLGALAADGVNAAAARADRLLSWEAPGASARALGYAWLATQLAWLAAPGYVIGGASSCVWGGVVDGGRGHRRAGGAGRGDQRSAQML
jgi:hypothetical protein